MPRPAKHQRMDMDMKAFAYKVRFFRTQKNLTQLEVAFFMNRIWRERFPKERLISEDWIRKIEMGVHNSVSIDRVIVLAEALEVPFTDLVPEELSEEEANTAKITLALRDFGLDETGIQQTLEQARYWLEQAKKKKPGSNPQSPQDTK